MKGNCILYAVPRWWKNWGDLIITITHPRCWKYSGIIHFAWRKRDTMIVESLYYSEKHQEKIDRARWYRKIPMFMWFEGEVISEEWEDFWDRHLEDLLMYFVIIKKGGSKDEEATTWNYPSV